MSARGFASEPSPWLSAACSAAAAAADRPAGARRRRRSRGPAGPADSLVATASERRGDLVHAGAAGQRRRAARCIDRAIEIRRDGTRVPVPLLYTGTAPEIVNDTTLRARLSEHCRPGDALSGGPPDRPSRAGAIDEPRGAGRCCSRVARRAARPRRSRRRASRARSAGSTKTKAGRSTGWAPAAADRPARHHVARRLPASAWATARERFAGLGFDVTAFRAERGAVSRRRRRGGDGLAALAVVLEHLDVAGRRGRATSCVPASFLRVGVEARWREISLDRRRWARARGRPLVQPRRRRRKATRPAAGDSRTPATGARPPGDASAPTLRRPRSPRRPARATPAGPARRLGHRHRDGGHGPALRVRRHRRRRRRASTARASSSTPMAGTASRCRGAASSRRGKAQKVTRAYQALRPGDLLTFSNRGGPVTHVGLYIGEGRFIHSATRGVQVSVLSADDPYGRWWYVRWVGVRRIVE